MFLLLALFALSVSAQMSTNALPPLAPAYPQMPPTFWEQHQGAIIVGSVAFIALAFLFLKVLLRPESKLILPPEVLARQALAKLQQFPEDGKLLSEVSHILRHYVVAAFELPSGELTTAEFGTTLAGNEKTGAELAQLISDFLHECDRRKFSSLPAVAPLKAVSRALELIALAELRRARIPAAK